MKTKLKLGVIGALALVFTSFSFAQTQAQAEARAKTEPAVMLPKVRVSSGVGLTPFYNKRIAAFGNRVILVVDHVEVTRVLAGSRAEKAGVKVGMNVISYNGHLLVGMTLQALQELMEEMIPADQPETLLCESDPGFWKKSSIQLVSIPPPPAPSKAQTGAGLASK